MSITHTTIKEQLENGKSVVYFTVGCSMKPLLINRKTHVSIAPIGKPKRMDILLYKGGNRDYILHRLIRQDDNYYYTRGDNTFLLEKIPKNQAFGVVTSVRRNGKIIDVNKSVGYRLYSRLWNFIYPIRFLWRKSCIGLGRIVSRLKK